jgi:hypothetical protein
VINVKEMDNQSSTIETLIDRAKSYAETRLHILRLKGIDKLSAIISLIVSMIAVLLISFIFVMFLSIGIAIYLGELLGNYYFGFLIMAAFYLITGLLLFKFRDKWLKAPIVNSLIKSLLD